MGAAHPVQAGWGNDGTRAIPDRVRWDAHDEVGAEYPVGALTPALISDVGPASGEEYGARPRRREGGRTSLVRRERYSDARCGNALGVELSSS